MATSDSDFEHWPEDSKCFTQFTKPAVAPPEEKKVASAEEPKTAPPVPTNFIQQPQPIYYAHTPSAMTYPQPQYYSHPPQAYYPPQFPQPNYYSYAPAPIPAPAMPPPAATAPPANYHVYQPAGTEPQVVPGAPQANTWLGRSKVQVEEDNMKIAKKEGVYDKRKMAPIDVKDDQFFWVVELDGKTSLRDFRFIKTIKGDWKEDPRFEGAYYFVREEEKKEEKKGEKK